MIEVIESTGMLPRDCTIGKRVLYKPSQLGPEFEGVIASAPESLGGTWVVRLESMEPAYGEFRGTPSRHHVPAAAVSNLRPASKRPTTIRELQDNLPWGSHNYSATFQAYAAAHRDYAHAFLHVQKALGKLAVALDDADHIDNVSAAFKAHPPASKYIADLIICALRMASTCPEGHIDVQAAIEQRIAEIDAKAAEKARGER